MFSGNTALIARIDDAVGFAVAKQMLSDGAKVIFVGPISWTIDGSVLRKEPHIVDLTTDGRNEDNLQKVYQHLDQYKDSLDIIF